MDETFDASGAGFARDDHIPVPGGALEMNRKWAYFIGASILAGYFLLTAGAPPLAIAAGIGGVALFMRRTSRTT
jgi:hypothetical protein